MIKDVFRLELNYKHKFDTRAFIEDFPTDYTVSQIEKNGFAQWITTYGTAVICLEVY